MTKLSNIVILDQINAMVVGVDKKDLLKIIEKIAVMTPGARHTAAFRIGAWDGKEAQLTPEGRTFTYMLPDIINLLDTMGYKFNLEDRRKNITTPNKIEFDYLAEFGTFLRDYQVEAINQVIDNKIGLVDAATASGKTTVSAAICKLWDDIGSITIVPSVTLVNQTYETYTKVGFDVGRFSGAKKEIGKKHTIATYQALNRSRDLFKNFNGAVIYDEAHIMGDTMYSFFKNELRHAPIRVGLTGTVPTDKYKKQKLFCHIGGGVIYSVKPHELMEEGYISSLDIKIVPVKHYIDITDGDWTAELAYLNKNAKRRQTIKDYLLSLPPKNRLILTHPEFGRELAIEMGLDFVAEETLQKDRDGCFLKFKDDNNYNLVASYGTSSTGISVDEIESVILVECGKNQTRIIQSIGRGLRLDSKNCAKKLEVIDIYSELYKDMKFKYLYGFSGRTHLKDRLKIYKDNKYPYKFADSLTVC